MSTHRRRPGAHRLLALALVLGASGCAISSLDQRAPPPIVGVWLVRAPEAPFPLHLFAFHSDGTVEQSNPDAGDPNTSDSNLMGVWRPDGADVSGKLVEVAADRTTHQLVRRVEISFSLRVTGDTFSGTAEARFYDAAGQPSGGHVRASLAGQRVVP
jgi:hypothetical protein